MVLFCILLLISLILIGMPIGFVLLITGSIGLYLVSGFDILQSYLSTSAYRSVNNFTFSAIPLFILMAHFISKSKIADDLFDSILKWFGHLPGGAGISTIFGSAGFGALSGSSLAATSVMSQIAVPKMITSKYSPSFASGLVATATGTLAVMIPPSIPLVLYGIQTETSIGKLLIAGIFPGLLLASLLCLTVIFVGIKQKSMTEKYPWKERFLSLKFVWPVVILVFFVIGIIYLGIATPTESAAFGATGALVIGLLARRLKFKDIVDSLLTTIRQTGMIFIIIIGSVIFSYFITLSRIGNDILEFIQASGFPAWTVLLLVILLYLGLGLFMDLLASMLITLPLVFPLITSLGYDPIWFGIIVVLVLEIGLVTPPVGINLFITSQHTGIPVQKVFLGSVPFIGVLLLSILILCFFPQIALYLPSLM
ncbi:TRAP transporter large permease [Bacillus sp. B15-48]|uniref:TRAP transporter large permease n=1 Tax=Bacillus sp. B15-48 TaxID=1548601 RepID=UPI00193F5B23|nr:TRAP transporter large permease [Bacillus sp. B15-48]MBM4763357.1 TRAP transporter large permease subunit [Bacillus sp. B15-48]